MMRTMRGLVWALLLAGPSCAATLAAGDARPAVLRDVESYAIASCLAQQTEPFLKDQGDGWASVVVQRGKGELDSFTDLGDTVKAELSKGEMAVIRVESESGAGEKALPVLYCGEIIDKPAVRAAIQKAVAALSAEYAN